MKPLLIYCYDAYCGWCYGFSPIIRRIAFEFQEQLDSEVLSGGMIMPENPVPISATASYIRSTYQTVEARTGIKFGEDYLWHILHPEESDWFPNSLKPAIAMCIFKEYFPAGQVSFAADLQYALHFEGRDLTDDEAYRHLLEKYKLPGDEFYQKLKDSAYNDKAREEFALVRQLRVNGFPTVFIQSAESKFYQAARGYCDYDQLRSAIEQVLHSLTKASSSS